jgi:hypothetical protein
VVTALRVTGAVIAAGALIWAWTRIGFIWMDEPIADQKRKSDIFAPTAPKYRRTYERHIWKTRTTQRAEARRRQA